MKPGRNSNLNNDSRFVICQIEATKTQYKYATIRGLSPHLLANRGPCDYDDCLKAILDGSSRLTYGSIVPVAWVFGLFQEILQSLFTGLIFLRHASAFSDQDVL